MMNDCDLKNAGNKIDLTLKLGLPSCAENYPPPPRHIGQHLDFDQIMTPHHANLEGIKRSKMVMKEGLDETNIGKSFSTNEIPWTPKFGSQFTHSQYCFHPLSGFPNNPYHYPHSNNFFNMNPNNNNLLGGAQDMKDYTLLDVPSRRIDRELGIGGSSHRTTGVRRQRGGDFIDPFRRCTNYNCNTNDTPMWRRGPLGPKTLCNACGIKYRKEEEKRKVKEAGRSNSQDSNHKIA